MDHRRALVGVSALALLVGLVVPAAAVSSAGALPGGRVALSGTVSPAATRAPRVGAVAASSEVDFELALALRDRSGAEALANASSTTQVVYKSSSTQPTIRISSRAIC